RRCRALPDTRPALPAPLTGWSEAGLGQRGGLLHHARSSFQPAARELPRGTLLAVAGDRLASLIFPHPYAAGGLVITNSLHAPPPLARPSSFVPAGWRPLGVPRPRPGGPPGAASPPPRPGPAPGGARRLEGPPHTASARAEKSRRSARGCQSTAPRHVPSGSRI